MHFILFSSRVDSLLSFYCLLKPVKYCILMMAGQDEGWYFLFLQMDMRRFLKD